MRIRKIYFLIFFLLLLSCEEYPNGVSKALSIAGENHSELIKVLQHYKHSDKQKYEAACFLIENMPYHKSKYVIEIDSSYLCFFKETDSIFQQIIKEVPANELKRYKPKSYDNIRKTLGVRFSELTPIHRTINVKSDIECIDANFLISNIEEAFALWDTSPLIKNMSFEEFKELILPYRCTNEEITKRTELKEKWNSILWNKSTDSVEVAIENFVSYVNKCRWINQYAKVQEHVMFYDLLLPKFKMDCHNMTNWSNLIFKACGIPVAYEYTPQWRDKNSRHFWCSSPSSSGVWKAYSSPDNNLGEDWESHIKYAGKVYRRTFSAQKNTPYFLASTQEYIPEEFNTPCLLDQTYRYSQTVDLYFPYTENIQNNIAYLCMFQGHQLNPVAWGTVNKTTKEICFKQVPVNTIFVAVYYHEKQQVKIDIPFQIQSIDTNVMHQNATQESSKVRIVEGGLIELLNPQNRSFKLIKFTPKEENIDEMILLRKYPVKSKFLVLHQDMIGAILVGSNDNKTFDTLFSIQSTPIPMLQEFDINNTKKYRFYRFFSANKRPSNVAHLEFLGNYSSNHHCSLPTPLPKTNSNTPKAFDSSLYRINGIPLKDSSKPELPFDDNLETYSGASNLGMDFTIPVNISKIRFAPRIANNHINIGHKYSLWYYDGLKWEIHSIAIAHANYLKFENLPAGTLYWLRDLTAGREELPFTYRDNEQHFINLSY